MMSKISLIQFFLLLILGFTPLLISCRHEADISNLPEMYYDTDIQPIINANCTMCHSEYRSYNGLLDIVKPGKPHQSELYKIITNPWALLRMPEAPMAPLSSQQRSIINLWILQGAPLTK